MSTDHADSADDRSASGIKFYAAPAFVAVCLFLILAFIVAKITKSRFLTAVCVFPAGLVVTNTGLALILLPCRAIYLLSTGNKSPYWFEWIGEVTLLKQCFMPLLNHFWVWVFNWPPYVDDYALVATSVGMVIFTQVALWLFFARGLNRDVSNAIYGAANSSD